MRIFLSFFLFFLIFSCNEINEDGAIPSDYTDCYFINESISNYDLFEDYFTLTLNHGYTPEITKDSLMNDYFFLKFKSESLNGIYVIIDANSRFNINKVIPYDETSKDEYPFSVNLKNEGACVFLDQIRSERCDCNN